MAYIYKITNQKNGKMYIGKTIGTIAARWQGHLSDSRNPDRNHRHLYRAMNYYGIDNFTIEPIEEIKDINQLEEREKYWIEYYKPEYNQTIGENFNVVPQKLTYEQVQQIQQILINDIEGKISHKKLGEQFGVSGKDTIRDINVGRTWYNPDLKYPLHISHLDSRYIKHCKICGCTIRNESTYCQSCNGLLQRRAQRPTREELKQLIRTTPFTQIGKQFGVGDNAIRKWCDNMNLPRTKKEINSYSNEEWEKI